jgi:hypothetical protein
MSELDDRLNRWGEENPFSAGIVQLAFWVFLIALGAWACRAQGVANVCLNVGFALGAVAAAIQARKHGNFEWARQWRGVAIDLFARVWPFKPKYANEFEQRAHEERERETGLEIRMIAEAQARGSDEDRLYLGDARPAMEAKLAQLLTIPRLSPAQHRERAQLESWLAQDRQGAAPTQIQGFAAPIAPTGILSAFLAKWQLWAMGALLAFGLGGWGANAITGARLDNAKGDLSEARADLRQAETDRDQWKGNYEAAHQEVITAQQQAAQTTRTIEQERARTRAARAAERRRQNEIRDVLVNDTPPSWGLPDAVFEPGAAGAPDRVSSPDHSE